MAEPGDPHPLHLLNSFVSISLVVSCPSLLVPAGPRLEPACPVFALGGLVFFWA